MSDTQDYRSGYVSIIGLPNVGKSTLLNGLLQQKLSIVTPKPQTTRQRVLGILSGDSYQAIFLDTPGILKPRYRLHEYMREEIHKSLEDADVVVLMIDAADPDRTDAEDLQEMLGQKPLFLVINKIDALPSRGRLEAILRRYPNGIPVSARTGEGLAALSLAVSDGLSRTFREVDVETDVGNGKLLAYLAAHGEVLSRSYNQNRVTVHCRMPQKYLGRIPEGEAIVRSRGSNGRPVDEPSSQADVSEAHQPDETPTDPALGDVA